MRSKQLNDSVFLIIPDICKDIQTYKQIIQAQPHKDASPDREAHDFHNKCLEQMLWNLTGQGSR